MNAHAVQREVPTLDDVQCRIDATPHGRLTLDPKREEATSLADLVSVLAGPSKRDELSAVAATVAQAQLDNFPENLFWDFDCFLSTVHRHAVTAADYHHSLVRACATTVTLMKLYGAHSKIRFRYVHDFIYGFDWARWVRRNPGARQTTEPFGEPFLEQSESRARDILRLIEEDDSWYPELKTESPRNPFPFVREPEDELLLYRDLAAHRYVPVPAWCVDTAGNWDRDYDALREARAEALGLGRRA